MDPWLRSAPPALLLEAQAQASHPGHQISGWKSVPLNGGQCPPYTGGQGQPGTGNWPANTLTKGAVSD